MVWAAAQRGGASGPAVAMTCHLAPWMPWATTIDDLTKAEAWLRKYAEDQARDGKRVYGIWLDGVLVGGAGFASFHVPSGVRELGAWLAPEARAAAW